MVGMDVPTYDEMAWPTLRAIKNRGGSATVRELSEDVASSMGLSDEVLEQPHGKGSMSEFEYRSTWTRTYLKKMGLIDNSHRGVWSLTDDGRQLDSGTDFTGRFREIAREAATERSRRKAAPTESVPDSLSDEDRQDNLPVDPEGDPAGEEWSDILLGIIQQMQSGAFERLCQRVLRAHGFVEVKGTGGPGDKGIDGMGVLRVGLVSFQVAFQCKRYAGAVGPADIRDFRGAMTGRADKGLFLTTGYFSRSAKHEAVRDGVSVIDLIDGLEICKLLKAAGLGVETETVVDPAFFEQFEHG